VLQIICMHWDAMAQRSTARANYTLLMLAWLLGIVLPSN
jgi:hypothetical protein